MSRVGWQTKVAQRMDNCRSSTVDSLSASEFDGYLKKHRIYGSRTMTAAGLEAR